MLSIVELLKTTMSLSVTALICPHSGIRLIDVSTHHSREQHIWPHNYGLHDNVTEHHHESGILATHSNYKPEREKSEKYFKLVVSENIMDNTWPDLGNIYIE